LPLSAESVHALRAPCRTLKTEAIGIIEQQIRSGYSGFVFLTGIAR
jgi:hypothetical protein